MKKTFISLLTLIALMPVSLFADSIKLKKECLQSNNGFLSVITPIKLRYEKLNVSYNKGLYISCKGSGIQECTGATFNTQYDKEGFKFSDLTIMEGLKETIKREGFIVLEWGINIITVDINNNSIEWKEIMTSKNEGGIGKTTCLQNLVQCLYMTK